MPLNPDFVVKITKGHDIHHRVLARRHNAVVQYPFDPDYSTLQEAVNSAISLRIPLEVFSNHALTEPLIISGADFLQAKFYGALSPAVDMGAVVEINDCRRCSFMGLRIGIASTRTVDNALYIRRAGGSITALSFEHTIIQGTYNAGIRLGEPDDGGQLDQVHFRNTMISGANQGTGVVIGTGTWANHKIFSFDDLSVAYHDTAIHMRAVDTVSLSNLSLNGSSQQDILMSADHVIIEGGRSENSARFLVSGANSGAYNTTIRHIKYTGLGMAEDGIWLNYNFPGHLALHNITCQYSAHPSVMKFGPARGLLVDMAGVITDQPWPNAVNANASTMIQQRGYSQNNDAGQLIAQWVDGEKVYEVAA